MIRKSSLLFLGLVLAAGCATEPEKPKPAAAPAPAPAPVARAAEVKPPPKPVAEKVTFASDVLFDFDKAVIRPDGQTKLDELAGRIKGVNLEVVIGIGHADRIGSAPYNQRLSVRRAAPCPRRECRRRSRRRGLRARQAVRGARSIRGAAD